MKRITLVTAALALLLAAGAPALAAQADVYKAEGTVNRIDAKTGKVSIKHGPVPELKWPAMTMPFLVKDKAVLEKLQAGKKIDFEFVQQGRDYVITSVK